MSGMRIASLAAEAPACHPLNAVLTLRQLAGGVVPGFGRERLPPGRTGSEWHRDPFGHRRAYRFAVDASPLGDERVRSRRRDFKEQPVAVQERKEPAVNSHPVAPEHPAPPGIGAGQVCCGKALEALLGVGRPVQQAVLATCRRRTIAPLLGSAGGHLQDGGDRRDPRPGVAGHVGALLCKRLPELAEA